MFTLRSLKNICEGALILKRLFTICQLLYQKIISSTATLSRHYNINLIWNQSVVRHNQLKRSCYTFQLIDDICWIFFLYKVFFPTTFFLPWRIRFIQFYFQTFEKFEHVYFFINWTQLSIPWKCQLFRYYITQLLDFKKLNSIKNIINP